MPDAVPAGADAATGAQGLRPATTVLAEGYDVALLDLDGVVCVGRDAVPAAPAALTRARARGMRLAFVTNNASRTPTAVAEHLRELGIPATAHEVVTSAQAAARVVAGLVPPGRGCWWSVATVCATLCATEAFVRWPRPTTRQPR